MFILNILPDEPPNRDQQLNYYLQNSRDQPLNYYMQNSRDQQLNYYMQNSRILGCHYN